jgi:hypothetical protein
MCFQRCLLFSFVCFSTLGAALPGLSKSIYSVKSEGFAVITSTLPSSVYRQRAIENALQNIALDQEQSVSSFTVIENGQMLIDQIQSRSSTGVLSYTVSDEKKTNTHYYVTIDAVIKNGIEPDKGKVANVKCRNTTIDAVDYSASINLDLRKLPAWVLISEAWLKGQIESYNTSPRLLPTNKKTRSYNRLYTYDLNEVSDETHVSGNINKLFMELALGSTEKSNLFGITKYVQLEIKITTKRNNEVIEIQRDNFEFEAFSKNAFNFSTKSSRELWELEKQNISYKVKDSLTKSLDKLKCIEIAAKVKRSKDNIYVDYGSLDGIQKEDIFVLETDKPQKLYLKVTELEDYRTVLEPITNRVNTNFSAGQIVRLVEGL